MTIDPHPARNAGCNGATATGVATDMPGNVFPTTDSNFSIELYGRP